jgi:hypothetical protein
MTEKKLVGGLAGKRLLAGRLADSGTLVFRLVWLTVQVSDDHASDRVHICKNDKTDKTDRAKILLRLKRMMRYEKI